MQNRVILAPRFGNLALLTIVLSLCATVLLWFGYQLPLERRYDVGSDSVPLFGTYGNERNPTFTYRYTKGITTLLCAQAGTGGQIVRLSLGGPSLSVPVAAQINAAGRILPLGTVSALRTYHILAPTDPDGDLRAEIISHPVHIHGDSRPLGVLIDRISIHSTNDDDAPLFVLFCAALTIATGVGIVRPRRWRSISITVALAVLVVAALLVARGRIELPPLWWVTLAALWLVALGTLIRSNWLSRAQPLATIAALFGFWRSGLWLVGAFGIWFSGAFSIIGEALSRDGNRYDRKHMLWDTLVQGWVQWDSEHYMTIAHTGYTFQGERWPNIAFFPLYPILIRLIIPLTGGSYELAGVLVANLALFGALIMFYLLISRDFGRSTALWAATLLLLIPTSFFFGALYSESLALLLAIAAVWAIRSERWWLAGLAGMLLALTRVPGVMIAPVIALAYLQSVNWRLRALRWPILAAGLPPLGLALFMGFQWYQFGTPFAFMQAQQAWENQLSLPWVLPLTLSDMISHSPDWPILVFQALFYVAYVSLAIVAFWRLPLAYSLTTALLLVAPLLSNWTWSISRHVLIGFGVVLMLALLTSAPRARWWVMGFLVPLLVTATLLFVNGWWIA